MPTFPSIRRWPSPATLRDGGTAPAACPRAAASAGPATQAPRA